MNRSKDDNRTLVQLDSVHRDPLDRAKDKVYMGRIQRLVNLLWSTFSRRR